MGKCSILHVRNGAGASGDGCSEGAPLGSIAAAIARARASQSTGDPAKEIWVCAGTYAEGEALVLDVPVSLRGSIACETSPWTPPAVAPMAPSTLVLAAKSPGLHIFGSGIGRSVIVSGLDLTGGGALGASPAIGIIVDLAAAPVLADNRVQAGTGSSTTFGSVALVVVAGGSPLARDNVLIGGPGALLKSIDASLVRAAGSAGIIVGTGAGPVILQRNAISGGPGTSAADGPASVGVVVLGQDVVVDGGSIGGGTGTTTAADTQNPAPVGSSGLVVKGLAATPAVVTITGSVVLGGRSNGGTGSASFGVVASHATIELARTRIYGGDAGYAAESTAPTVAGGIVAAGSVVKATNCVIHAGGGDAQGHAKTGMTRAVTLDGASFAGRHVTMLAGTAGGNTVGFYLVRGDNVVTLADSLMVAHDPKTYAFFADRGACGETTPNPKPYQAILERVVFVQPEVASTPSAGFLAGGWPGACGKATLPAGLKPPYFPAAATELIVSSTLVVAPASSLSAADCGSNVLCNAALFASYSAVDAGRASVLAGRGLAPKCSAPQRVRAGAMKSSELTIDLTGELRGGSPTIGALEVSCK